MSLPFATTTTVGRSRATSPRLPAAECRFLSPAQASGSAAIHGASYRRQSTCLTFVGA